MNEIALVAIVEEWTGHMAGEDIQPGDIVEWYLPDLGQHELRIVEVEMRRRYPGCAVKAAPKVDAYVWLHEWTNRAT